MKMIPEPLPEVLGSIPFPCGCSTRLTVLKGARGHITAMCPKCRKVAVFDLEALTAERLSAAPQRELRKLCTRRV